MKILIFGAGAIGGFLGAKLVQSGNQVTLLARPLTAEAIFNSGLVLGENGQTETTFPAVVTSLGDAHALGPFQTIVFTVKSYDLAAACEALAGYTWDQATLITMQNGIDVEQPLIDRFGAHRLVAGSLTTPVSRDALNAVRVERAGRGLCLAAPQAAEDLPAWVSLFNEAGIETWPAHDYQAMKWSKVLLNIVANASSAILDMTPGAIYGDDGLFEMEMQMLRETLAVMKRKGLQVINLPGSPAARLAWALGNVPRFLLKPFLTRLVSGGRGNKMPSFHLDLSSGRGNSEVPFHNGAIAKAGERAGISTDVNRTLNDVLMAITREETPWTEYAGRRQHLLRDVQQEKDNIAQ